MYYLLNESNVLTKKDLSNVRLFISGGAPISKQVKQQFEELEFTFNQFIWINRSWTKCFLYIDPRDKNKQGSSNQFYLLNYV